MLNKKHWVILSGLAVLALFARIPALEEPLDPDSGANAFIARQMLRGELLYDKYHPGHHLPGIYYTNEIAFKLFGDNAAAPKLLLIPFTFACAYLLFLMGQTFLDDLSGILAAVFFILVSSEIWLTGTFADMGQFANLALTGCIFLSILLIQKNRISWQFVWVGLLGAICILYKVTFIAPLAVTGLLILITTIVSNRGPARFKISLVNSLWLLTGLILPLAGVVEYFISHGLGHRFLLIFSNGFNYLDNKDQMIFSSLPAPFGFPLVWLGINNIVLLILGLLGTFHFMRQAYQIQHTENIPRFSIALWLIFSFMLAGIRGGGFPNYAVQCIPPLALIGAAEISEIFRKWKGVSYKKALWSSILLTALVVFNYCWWNYNLYDSYINYKLGHISFQDFLYRHSIFAPRFISTQSLVNYIELHTAPTDLVYFWSVDVQFYYYADRNPPIDMLWPYYVSASGPPERVFSALTKYIILDEPDALARPQWLMNGLAQNYFLETTIDGKEVFKRRTYQ